MGSLHCRSAWIVLGWSRKATQHIVPQSKESEAAVAVEKLEELWHNVSQKSSATADKLSRFACRKLLLTIFNRGSMARFCWVSEPILDRFPQVHMSYYKCAG